MSPVPQLFSAVRGRLIADPALQEVLATRIYFNLPQRLTYPCVVFGIDAIVDNNDTCLITFNMQLLSLQQNGAEPLKTAHAMNAALEETMNLNPTTKATCRKTSMTIDLKQCEIKQFYQAMVWRNQYD